MTCSFTVRAGLREGTDDAFSCGNHASVGDQATALIGSWCPTSGVVDRVALVQTTGVGPLA
jgi:hypothetical protein